MQNSDDGTELVSNQEDNSQPNEVVADKLEGKEDSLQSTNTDTFELEIDNEGEPETTPENKPDYEKARKAFKEREEKRLKREQEEREKQELIDRINRLESENSKSKKPTLESCDYDEELFDKKLSEYYQSQSSPAKNESEKANNSSRNVDPEIEIKAARQEDEIRKKLPAYDDIKVDLAMKFANDGVDPDAVLADIQTICHHAGIDSAKAVIGLAKVPNAYSKLKEIAGNSVAVSSFLGKVTNQVKIAQAKKVDSVPEPQINSSGAIDNTAATINKLYEKWQETGSIQDYKALQDARKKLKGK